VSEACLHGTDRSSYLPQGVVDIPGTRHLLRFVGIIVLFKVMGAGFISLKLVIVIVIVIIKFI